ncbi:MULTISPECIES: fumarylacetoacetate hydrolase family protein [unclassified Burkholderia]|uniref:fumarylacetoacetate hydrolase family protein n=1 Tax=unclassified Burkholderia TaxID=2613784 RepID=UPI000F565976|nr:MULTISPECIES: fumarylacetoacetate hydrolase family protein [unclassified Burkholderia]RQR30763.1 2-keto-4-pentenoate hydratase [Burkholderia sp. Bp9142]RQR45983.1 2-keto-4-pentenoate hydratase [Burkholderia sp. Bp9140]RQZ21013.1 2-keto-4-pentenoate hydratase [Burkholderia sp. Bp9031]
MLTPQHIDALAARLRAAERERAPIKPLRMEIGEQNAEDAYAIQQANAALRRERVVGRKIGLTSLAVQQQLGVDQPDFGTLFASMAYGDAEPMSLSQRIQPKVEAEIALVLEHDLVHEKHTFAELQRATAYALAAIEVVDSRIAGWNIRFVDTVADNASSALFVLGSRPVLLKDVDLAGCEMTLASNGEVLSRGSGTACLGNPLNAAAWLADRMVRHGTPLRAGDVILTGALGPMVAVTRPGTFTAQIAGLGSVRATFNE